MWIYKSYISKTLLDKFDCVSERLQLTPESNPSVKNDNRVIGFPLKRTISKIQEYHMSNLSQKDLKIFKKYQWAQMIQILMYIYSHII